jgi:phosphate transport system permease protein
MINNGKSKQVILDKSFNILFLISACIAILAVLSIAVFIFYKGSQPFIPGNAEGNYSLWEFLTGTYWKPSNGVYDIGYMIVASIFATIGALIIGVPISLLTAIFIAEIAPKKLASIVRMIIELLASIPSVLYGVFGYEIIVKFVKRISPFNIGDSLLSVIFILSIMILPTIVSISESAIRAVPSVYKEAAYGLGATKTEVIFKTILPAGKSGILAAVVLGIGRAIGETMAVILVAGNPEGNIPRSIFDQVRLITNNIVLEQGYASGMHEEMLFATGIVLFVFIIIVNLALNMIRKGVVDE